MSRTASGSDYVRRSIEMHPKTDDRIRFLMQELEATSITEVVRRALQVLEQLVVDEKRGRRLFVEDERGRMIQVSMRYAGISADRPGPAAQVVPFNGVSR